MGENKSFFGKYEYCKGCSTLLPKDYQYEYCPRCLDQELFKLVRDYIRNNDVTEYDVADEFGIPIQHVKGWIREGRIQYKEEKGKAVLGNRCASCGEIIISGIFCSKCRDRMINRHGILNINSEEFGDNKMRFLGQDKDELSKRIDENGKEKKS